MTGPDEGRRAVVPAGRAYAEIAAALIAESFSTLAVAAWLVPDPVEREAVLRADFRILVDHAVVHGMVSRTTDGAGVAVWFPREGAELPEDTDYRRRREWACGPHLERFLLLDRLFARQHPTEPRHHHLALLAVAPDRQGKGTGSLLLDHHHRRLDRSGTCAYLEASSPRSRALYARHGYVDLGPPIDLPDGPRLWPMWRAPRSFAVGRPVE